VSPILLRPIREQLEHDRVIRQLQTRWRRRYEVGINVGNEETVSARSGDRTCFPDLVLINTAGGRRLHGVVEVETTESVNHLEAMSEWSHFAKVRGSFYLYVPAGFTDVALRLCQAIKINVTEIWAYYAIDSQAKFSMAYRSPRARQQPKVVKVKTAKKPTSARKSKTAKKLARTKTKKSTTASKHKNAATATKRAPVSRTATKEAKRKASSSVATRRAGKTSAARVAKRPAKRSRTAKRKT